MHAISSVAKVESSLENSLQFLSEGVIHERINNWICHVVNEVAVEHDLVVSHPLKHIEKIITL